jgi:ribonuclease VapC
VLAIMLGEGERALFEDLILHTPAPVMSVVSVVETSISLQAKRRDYDAARLDESLSTLRIEIVPVGLDQGLLAWEAFFRYGRGRNPARLNFGDCFAYALAKAREDTLLFKGDDFAKTDVIPAWRP